jgi:subtilisin family serine protease
MIRYWALIIVAVFVSVSLGAAPAGPDQKVAEGSHRYIVVLKDGKDPATVLTRQRFQPRVTYQHVLKGFAGEMPEAVRAKMAADADVAYIEEDKQVHKCQQTVPTGVQRIGTTQNPIANIGAHQNVNAGLAILDTGIDPTHPDLNVVGGWNFITNTSSFNDDEGHGTHCAGIAAAIDNDLGVVGVAPGARLWALKFLDSSGGGFRRLLRCGWTGRA